MIEAAAAGSQQNGAGVRNVAPNPLAACQPSSDQEFRTVAAVGLCLSAWWCLFLFLLEGKEGRVVVRENWCPAGRCTIEFIERFA